MLTRVAAAAAIWKGRAARSSSSSLVWLFGKRHVRMFSTPVTEVESGKEKSFVEDRSLNYIYSNESEV